MTFRRKILDFLFSRKALVVVADKAEPAAIKPNPKREQISFETPGAWPPNFSYEELIASAYAERHGIKNIPNATIKERLRELAWYLQSVRDFLGHPMTISSGYRSWPLNRGVRGSRTSDHPNGWAADFWCWGYGNTEEIVRALKNAGFKYDQIITEGSWVHVSIDPEMRGETMIATFKNGKASYSKFS